nr:hypothetical protein [Pseudoclavibacter terrae]
MSDGLGIDHPEARGAVKGSEQIAICLDRGADVQLLHQGRNLLLMVVDVLSAFFASRDHDWVNAVLKQREYGPDARVSDNDVRSSIFSLEVIGGHVVVNVSRQVIPTRLSKLPYPMDVWASFPEKAVDQRIESIWSDSSKRHKNPTRRRLPNAISRAELR